MQQQKYKLPILFSLLLHGMVLLVLIINLNWSAETPVLENADKNEHVIDAVALDVVPQPIQKPVERLPQKKVEPQPQPPVPKKQVETAQQDAIAIQEKQKKKKTTARSHCETTDGRFEKTSRAKKENQTKSA